MPGGVYICYRREDSAGFARVICDRLARRLGRNNVSVDVDPLNIERGLDFVEVVSKRVGGSDAVVVVIGRDWTSTADKDNHRRIHDSNDFVRIDIETALARNVPLIPVLVDGAAMPRPDDLPDSIKTLTRLQAFEISNSRFDADVERLTHALSLIKKERLQRKAVEAALGEGGQRQAVVETPHQVEEQFRTREAAEAERVDREERERQESAETARVQETEQLTDTEVAHPVKEPRRAREADRGRADALHYYVSYAWADESDPDREKDVDRLCTEARRRGISIIRDKAALRQRELISDFMKALGEGDRVFIFLSDKYLKSPFCMFELSELWRNSKQERGELLRHIRVFTVGVLKIGKPVDRLEYTKTWKLERDGLRHTINEIGWDEVGEEMVKEYYLMKAFTSEVTAILAFFADMVKARTFEDFVKDAFEDPA